MAIKQFTTDTTADPIVMNEIVDKINKFDLDVGDVTSLSTTEKSNVVGAINEVKAETDANGSAIGQNASRISKVAFRAHKPYRVWQGVSTDGEFIYATSDRNESFGLQNIISVYDMKGNFIKERVNAYTTNDPQGKFMSFGDCTIIDGKLFATVYNVNSGGSPLISRVVEFSLVDLGVINSHEIGAGVAECVVKKGSEYWVSYHDIQQVKKFNSSFSFLSTYSLSKPASSQGGYQGMFWVENDLYLNMHGANSHGSEDVGTLDRYYFNGITFAFVESVKPPTFGATQGVCNYNGIVYWNDRASNEIVITNSIKTSSLQPILTPITNNYIFKPTLLSDWIPFDATYDRPLKAWKDAFGVVHLEGIIKGGIMGQACCILPKGYIPQYSRGFAVDSNGAFGRVAIVGNVLEGRGQVIPAVGSNIYVCLDGITFLADPTM